MKDFWDKLLTWLKDVIPAASAIGGLVYSFMLQLIRRAEMGKLEAELERDEAKNELEVKKELEGKSDRDIVLDVANGESRSDPDKP